MATVRSSSFTGSNGAAWPLDAGSWTHTTETGTFSVGASETIQTNKGRASGTSSTATIVRRHHAGTGTFLNVEVSANVVRSNLNCKPGIMLRTTTSAASSSFYLLQAETSSGKSTSYGYALYKCVAGVYTALASVTSAGSFSTTASVLNFALRATTLPGGNVKLQWKAYVGSDPGWTEVAGETVGTITNLAGTGAYIDSTATIKDAAGLIGLYTETDAIIAYQADYDDLLAVDSWNINLGPPVLAAPSTLIDQITLPGYPHTITVPVLNSIVFAQPTAPANVYSLRTLTAPVFNSSSSLLAPKMAFNIRLPVIDSNQAGVVALTDSFNRADSTTLWGDGGIFWTGGLNSSTVGTSANKAYLSGAPVGSDPGGSLSFSYTGTYQDGSVSVDLLDVQNSAVVLLKYANSSNYYMVYFSGGVMWLYKKLAGVFTAQGSFAVTTGTNVSVSATYQDDLIRITVSNRETGVVLGSFTHTIVDAIFRGTGTYSGFGVYTGSLTTRFDSWYQTWGTGSGPRSPQLVMVTSAPALATTATLLEPQVNITAAAPTLSTTAVLLEPEVAATNLIEAPSLSTVATLLAPEVTISSSVFPFKIGVSQVATLYVGSAQATKIYVGATQLWP